MTASPPRRNLAAEMQQALGLGVRGLRARRGMTRKMLALNAGVSERHLANLESGSGNPSLLVLRQMARALDEARLYLRSNEAELGAW